MLRNWLVGQTGIYGIVGMGLVSVVMVLGPLIAQTAGGPSPTTSNWTIGGIAATACTSIAGVVRYMGGMVDKERARGDRLELALIDKAVTAIGSSASALQDLSREVREQRNRGTK